MTMKAVVADPIGGIENLKYVDVPRPEPAPGEVLVRIEAAGVNFIDIYHRSGLYTVPESPVRLGTEGAGVVEVADPSTGFKRGQRVAYAMARGSYAEYASVPARLLVEIPDQVSFEKAAALMLQGMTAHYLTRSTFPLQAGQTCLIHAAAGGAGLLTVQMAKIAGATVIGTTSTDEKARLAKEHGADHMVVYGQADFVEPVKRITGGAGVHVVYDSVGKDTFRKSVDCLRPRGMLVSFGQSSGPVGQIDPLLLSQKGSLYLTRPSLFNYISDAEELRWRSSEIFSWMKEGKLRVNLLQDVSTGKRGGCAARSREPDNGWEIGLETGAQLTGSEELAERRANLLPAWMALKASAFLITALPNIRYLSGFTGSSAALLLLPDRALLLTDPRYATQAPTESDCEVKIVKSGLMPNVLSWLRRLRVTSLAVEQNRISLEDFDVLDKVKPRLRLKMASGLVEQQRRIKSVGEITAIRNSVLLNSAALEEALRHFEFAGTELDLAAEIDYRMRRLGAEGTAFDTIVASAERTALPHAHPENKRVQPNQLLLVDMGARVAGYCSDMTRTFAVGKLSPKARRMYRAVLESQLAAIDAVRPGVVSSAVDRAARVVLRGYGLANEFVHSTGHGLGLEIHEGPRVGRKDRTELAPGMVITIEPGVYIEGMGGVRIEDTVVVTPTGCEVLTPTTKELVVL